MSYTVGTASFPRVKRPERDVNHSPLSSAEVEGRADYTFTPCLLALYQVIGLTLPLLQCEIWDVRGPQTCLHIVYKMLFESQTYKYVYLFIHLKSESFVPQIHPLPKY
jgi:hypothetical protein